MIRSGKSWFAAWMAVVVAMFAAAPAQAGGLQLVSAADGTALVSPLVVTPFVTTVQPQVVMQQVFVPQFAVAQVAVPQVIVQQRVVRQRVQVLGARRIVVQGLHCR